MQQTKRINVNNLKRKLIKFQVPHSAEGSSKVHEGPHRDHGHVLHKIQNKVIHQDAPPTPL